MFAREAGIAVETPQPGAEDYFTDVDAIVQGAERHKATHFSGGKLPMLYTPLGNGRYTARKAFMRAGYYHWPLSGDVIDALPSTAQPVGYLTHWLPKRDSAAEDGYQDNPRGPRCGVDAYGEYRHRGGCCPGRPACRKQRKEEGLCYCAAYHYPHRSGSGRCGSPEQMDRFIYGPRRDVGEEAEVDTDWAVEWINPTTKKRQIYFDDLSQRQAEIEARTLRMHHPNADVRVVRRGFEFREASEPTSFEVAPPAIPHEAAEQSEPAGESAAVPWVKIERDPKAYEAQIALAQAHGKIDSARAVYDMLAPSLAKEDQETFLVVGVDVRGQCRGVVLVHKGARSRVSVDIPEILRTANALGGEMFIVVHNHPTTRATPSQADKSLTKAIEKAARASEQVMMDHVIIGMGEFYSFADGKLTKVAKREKTTKPARTTSHAAADDDRPTIVIAPRSTPLWLTVGASDKTLLFSIWGMRVPGIEVDIPEENEGWSAGRVTWEKFRSELLSSAPEIISPQILFSDVKRGPKAKGLAPDDRAFAEGLKAIGVRHLGSPVWWTDLDQGPVAAASLYDVARFDQPYVIPRSELAADLIGVAQGETNKEVIKAMRQKIMRFHKRPLYLLSLDQWDNQEFPAPSQGGPPYIEHVSVGRES